MKQRCRAAPAIGVFLPRAPSVCTSHPRPRQSIAYIRQREPDRAVHYFRNLLACESASPSTAAVRWPDASELADLFAVYAGAEQDEELRRRAQTLLGIADEEAAQLIDGGAPILQRRDADEEAAIF